MTMSPAILVMAKVPRSGSVKTRLAPLLGHDGCARLQALLIAHTTELAASVAPKATYVAFYPADAAAEIAELVPDTAVLVPQHGAHLGERLVSATEEVLAARSGPLVVIGTDIPLLARSHLVQAFYALGTGHDAVFGPAEDGGYYLVGLARALPVIFDIDPRLWGGPNVLDATLTSARTVGLRVGLLGALRDLDTVDDVRALASAPGLPRDLRDVLASGLAATARPGTP